MLGMTTNGFRRRLIVFIQVCYGFTQAQLTQWVIHTKSCTHRLTHTPKQTKKKKPYKCKMFHVNLNNLFTVSSNGGEPYWSVLLWHQLQNRDRRRRLFQYDHQTTRMPAKLKITSCKEYVTWYHLFIRPTEEPLINNSSQIEDMEHSLCVVVYYASSSAICVS